MAQNSNPKQNSDDGYLPGKLLIAMPSMTDPRFHRSVIFMCAHDSEGAMGLMINKPLPGIDFADLLEQLNIQDKIDKQIPDVPVMSGGPVETARGFILHDKAFKEPDTVFVDDSYGVTGTIDAIRKISSGNAPEQMIFALGYAGWSAGQLDQEIQSNAWLTLDADPDLIFNSKPDDIWDMAVAKLGIDPVMLSSAAGRA